MENTRHTFRTSTTLTIPISVYRLLQNDAFYYGYLKNGKPNIGGFLNHLIPELSAHQNDLYTDLLRYHEGDAEKAKTGMLSIYNVYLSPSANHYDGTIPLSFRVSENKRDDFLSVHDHLLYFYNSSFTGYIRTLLSEYAAKKRNEREYLYAHKLVKILRSAMNKSCFCNIYTNDSYICLLPISIEPSPIYDYNYIVGITRDLQPAAIRLCSAIKAIPLDDKHKITEQICDSVLDFLNEIYDEELKKCSG